MRKLTYDELAGRKLPLDTATPGAPLPVCVVLDNIRSLYNVGSIFRTADAVCIRELLLTGYTPKPPRKEIEKTALGATNTVPWRHFRNTLEALTTLKSEGYTLCALELAEGSLPLHTPESLPTPLALVVGNEVVGVTPEALQLCDRAIEIPMYGMKHSLNVAVAVGVALYELSRRIRV